MRPIIDVFNKIATGIDSGVLFVADRIGGLGVLLALMLFGLTCYLRGASEERNRPGGTRDLLHDNKKLTTELRITKEQFAEVCDVHALTRRVLVRTVTRTQGQS